MEASITAAGMVQKQQSSIYDLNAVRILLVGDLGVGKTSLIHSLVMNEFEPNLPARVENGEVKLSAEVTPEHVPMQIVDYSSREQSLSDLRAAIKEANVICIVYIGDDDDSLERVMAHWIPTIRMGQSAGNYKPIILAANKIDLMEEEKSLDKITSVIRDFEDVDSFIEVSAKTQKNVVELFYLAQKAVLYPLAPLFDSHLRVLTRKCRNALIDVFKLCDIDGDGLLSDDELNKFHENCFGVPFQEDTKEDFKSIIKQSTMDGILNNSLTQSGFLFLHTFSIDKGRHSFTWRVLRKFNYDNQINKKIDRSVATGTESIQTSYDKNSNNLSQCKSSDPESSDNVIDNLHQLDLSWIRENSRMIRAGFGLTAVTLISALALKYLIQGGSKN